MRERTLVTATAGDGGAAKELRLLVVDDHEDEACVIARELGRRFGCAVPYVLGVEDALVSIDLRAPDVLVTDLNMGPRHGDELLRLVKAAYPTVRRILHTSTEPSALESLLEMEDAHAIVQKDGEVDSLVEVIERLIGCGHQAPTSEGRI